MAVTSARYDAYLQSVDLGGLDKDRARLERDIKLGKEGDARSISRARTWRSS